MADHEAVRRAAEAAVGDQCHVVAEPAAYERRRHREHLAHARAAGRPFIADHDHVTGLDRALLHGAECIFFAIEYARRTSEFQSALARQFQYAAFAREVAI